MAKRKSTAEDAQYKRRASIYRALLADLEKFSGDHSRLPAPGSEPTPVLFELHGLAAEALRTSASLSERHKVPSLSPAQVDAANEVLARASIGPLAAEELAVLFFLMRCKDMAPLAPYWGTIVGVLGKQKLLIW